MPLTSSLYVPGQLSETDKVMVDIGTGYYVEVGCVAPPFHILRAPRSCPIESNVVAVSFRQTSAKGGVDYCKRKVTLLTESLSALAEVRRD